MVRVSPGAGRSELVGRHGDGWRARVAAPPERGLANEELCRLLAEVLVLPRSSVRVAAGRSSRAKVVEIDGLEQAEIERRLTEKSPDS
jgi:uncharacterized protein (TIGR00251 family)